MTIPYPPASRAPSVSGFAISASSRRVHYSATEKVPTTSGQLAIQLPASHVDNSRDTPAARLLSTYRSSRQADPPSEPQCPTPNRQWSPVSPGADAEAWVSAHKELRSRRGP